MHKQVHVYYSGRVQGVGFRFTAENIATGLGMTGWVRNLGDGRVEVRAEGAESVVHEFLAEINKNFHVYIRDADIEWLPATGEFKDFSIAF